MEPIKIVISGYPAAAGRPRFGTIHKKDGTSFTTTFTPAKTRSWQAQAREQGIAQMKGQPPMAGALEVIAEVYLPIPKSMSKKHIALALEGQMRPSTRPDLDNYVKNFSDALNGIVWMDDAQIVTLYASKHFAERPRLEVTVQHATLSPSLPAASGNLFEGKA